MTIAGWLWQRPWEGAPSPGRLTLDVDRIGSVEAVWQDSAAEPMIGGETLWLPAPVNAHDHGRGLSPLCYGAPDDRLECWLWDLWRAPATDVYLTHLVAFGQMAQSGAAGVVHNHIQTTPDIVAEAVEVARAARDVGLRLAFVVPLIDQNLAGYDGGAAVRAGLSPDEAAALEAAQAQQPMAEQLAKAEAIAKAIDGPLVETQYGPPGPQWTSPASAAQIGAAAAAAGRRVHVHLLETRPQRDWMDTEHPGGAQDYLAEAGLLNERLTVAHGVHLRPAEARALASAGATLVINASSNLRLSSGVPDGAMLVEAGLRLGIGIDGLALDDDADLLREIRLSALVLGLGGGGRRTAFRAAFSDGHLALDGDAHPGLEPGAPADILGLSLTDLAADRVDDSTATLAALAAGRWRRSVVRELIVAGRQVVSAGALTGVDLAAAEAELHARARAARREAPPPAWIAKARAVAAAQR